jgi:L-asparagine transporter-like permease
VRLWFANEIKRIGAPRLFMGVSKIPEFTGPAVATICCGHLLKAMMSQMLILK